MKAFPTDRLGVIKDSRGISINEAQQDGMDLRDYFAGKAMQYFATDALFYGDDTDEEYILTAKLCYRYADAMMEARK